MDPGIVPQRPSSPNVPLILIGAALVGAVRIFVVSDNIVQLGAGAQALRSAAAHGYPWRRLTLRCRASCRTTSGSPAALGAYACAVAVVPKSAGWPPRGAHPVWPFRVRSVDPSIRRAVGCGASFSPRSCCRPLPFAFGNSGPHVGVALAGTRSRLRRGAAPELAPQARPADLCHGRVSSWCCCRSSALAVFYSGLSRRHRQPDARAAVRNSQSTYSFILAHGPGCDHK